MKCASAIRQLAYDAVPDRPDKYMQIGDKTSLDCLDAFCKEAVASQELWIWHVFFNVDGSNNDINLIRQSSLLNDLKEGIAPELDANDTKRIRYKNAHEVARKDMEQAFSVLKKK
ncbi:RNA-directed DNA polymerase, eukaryota [Tanacetum coccineum]